MSLIDDVRSNFSAIIAAWSTSLVFQRATHTIVSGYGGEFTNVWSTNLTTNGKFQYKGAKTYQWPAGGMSFDYDHIAYINAGLDVVEDDRIRMPGTTASASHYTYVRQVQKDADKWKLFCGRRRHEAE